MEYRGPEPPHFMCKLHPRYDAVAANLNSQSRVVPRKESPQETVARAKALRAELGEGTLAPHRTARLQCPGVVSPPETSCPSAGPQEPLQQLPSHSNIPPQPTVSDMACKPLLHLQNPNFNCMQSAAVGYQSDFCQCLQARF